MQSNLEVANLHGMLEGRPSLLVENESYSGSRCTTPSCPVVSSVTLVVGQERGECPDVPAFPENIDLILPTGRKM